MEIDIPRHKMPQIFQADLERDYHVAPAIAPIERLIPVQSQRLMGIVQKAAAAIAAGAHPQGAIIIDKYYRIINGHHRYDAYRLLGYVEIPVLIVTDGELFELIDRYSHTASDAAVI